jgi:predicted MFS family arabinose efflux permease
VTWTGPVQRLEDAVGGRRRLRAVVLLACVLGLNSADAASIGAVATQLEPALGIGHTRLGLLVTVSTALAAVVTLPLGWLVDRVDRVRLLSAAVVLWSVAMAISGAASSYGMLLWSRVGLGAVAATAAPVVASLTGDLFPAAERGRIYGFILSGELIGAGAGLMVSGDVAGWLSWRWAFWVLSVPGLVLAVALWRLLPEPVRGAHAAGAGGDRDELLLDEVRNAEVRPREALVLGVDPAARPLGWAVRYLLAIPTNRLLILSSALGYFFFGGLRTFAVVFARGRFHLDQTVATTLLVLVGLGGVLGVLVTGRLADRLIRQGRIAARPVVAGASLLLAAVMFAPGLLTTALVPALVLFGLGAAGVGGANPPLDAARLDIVHYRLWGRAESVRAVLRYAAEALAPLVFGLVSTEFGGHGATFGEPRGGENGPALAHTFLLMLVALVAAGLVLCVQARRTYARDVATALASERATSGLAKQRESGAPR